MTRLLTEFVTISGHDQAIDWINDRAIDWIVTNYILTSCLKIQNNFLKC